MRVNIEPPVKRGRKSWLAEVKHPDGGDGFMSIYENSLIKLLWEVLKQLIHDRK